MSSLMDFGRDCLWCDCHMCLLCEDYTFKLLANRGKIVGKIISRVKNIVTHSLPCLKHKGACKTHMTAEQVPSMRRVELRVAKCKL